MATKKQKGKPRKVNPNRRPAVKIQTVENVTERLRKYRGNLQAVADSFGITRMAVSSFIDHHPELRPIMREAREGRLDRAESKLDKAIDKGQPWSIRFLLETFGKSRGYIRQLQIAGGDPSTGNLPISITLPSNGREVLAAPPGTSQNEKQDRQDESDGEAAESGGDGAEFSVPGDRSATGTANDIPI